MPFTSFSENDKGPDGKRRSDRSRRTDNQATVQASTDHLLNWEVGMNRRGDWSIGPGEFSRLIYKSQRNIPSPTAEGRDEQHSYWDVYAAGHVSLNGMCFTLNVCAART